MHVQSSLDALAVIPADPLDLVPSGARVAVAMSGGVDSSVAAALCVQRGIDVVGITLVLWPGEREQVRDRGCCSVDAVDDARRVAASLGIRHYVWNLEREFQERVIDDFESEYAAGRTPNPCVRCNQYIKFGTLLERAQGVGATFVATGHYARSGRRGEVATLHRGLDSQKDQSYTVHRLSQEQLRAALFPLGGLPDKAAVREIASGLGLITAKKPDSQELCFVDSTIVVELQKRLAGRFAGGDIVDQAGQVIGQHDGLPFYTVGQRGRLNVAAQRPDAEPLYVLALDHGTNRVVVGPRSALLQARVGAIDWKWIGGAYPIGKSLRLQLRAHARSEPATLALDASGQAEFEFVAPVAQVTPGQSVVAYADDDDEVLGGGTIAWAR